MLARKVGMYRSNLSNLEAGKIKAGPRIVAQLIRGLGKQFKQQLLDAWLKDQLVEVETRVATLWRAT